MILTQIARVVALLCLLASALIPLQPLQIFKRAEIQLLVATIVCIILVLFDVYTGVILGVTLIMMYYRLYEHTIYSLAPDTRHADEVKNKGPMACLMNKYITDDHLRIAQNNVVDPSQLDTLVIGVPGMNSEQVFSAQGTYKKISGLDTAEMPFADAQFK